MTTEEKIDAIHEAVVEIKAELAAKATICAATHKTTDSRLDGLHKKIVGNGQPGLEQKHADLAARFDKLETRFVVWASVAVFLGQMLFPKLSKAIGW